MGNAITNLSGTQFGRLTVIRFNGITKSNIYMWQCVCECGNKKTVSSSNLKRGYTRSCGCIRVENAKRTALINCDTTTHGMTGTTEYRTWQAMKKRCINPKDKYYSIYGGRGIKVCDRWLESFENFFEDMGEKPTPSHTLDRFPNKNGNYELTNCRWATQKEQQNNRTNNHIIEHEGLSLTLSQWSEKLGIKSSTLRERLRKRGWSTEEALTA